MLRVFLYGLGGVYVYIVYMYLKKLLSLLKKVPKNTRSIIAYVSGAICAAALAVVCLILAMHMKGVLLGIYIAVGGLIMLTGCMLFVDVYEKES